MTIVEAIVARKSIRKYTKDALKEEVLEDINSYIKSLKPLAKNLNCKIEILKRAEYVKKFSTAFIPVCPDYLVISSDNGKGFLENAGYLGEQVVLYITSLGMGTCWLGSSRAKASNEKGASHIITIAFGRAEGGLRVTGETPQRIHLHDMILSPINDPRVLPMIDAARFAPSAMNLQPVRILPRGGDMHVFRKTAPFNINALGKLYQISAGVALANMFIAGEGSHEVARLAQFPEPPGNYIYVATLVENKDVEPESKK
jgi:nitroreductase